MKSGISSAIWYLSTLTNTPDGVEKYNWLSFGKSDDGHTSVILTAFMQMEFSVTRNTITPKHHLKTTTVHFQRGLLPIFGDRKRAE